LVSHEMITSGSPTEQCEICVSGAYFRDIWFPECGGHVTDRHTTDGRRTGTCADLENERLKNLRGNPNDSLLLCSSIVPTDYPPCSPPLIRGQFEGLSRRTRQKSPEKSSLHFPRERTYTKSVIIVACYWDRPSNNSRDSFVSIRRSLWDHDLAARRGLSCGNLCRQSQLGARNKKGLVGTSGPQAPTNPIH